MKTLPSILILIVAAGSARAQTVEQARQQMIEHTPPVLQLAPDWQPIDPLAEARARRNQGIALTVVGIGLELAAGVLWGYAAGTQFGDDVANAFGAHQHHDTSGYFYGALTCGVLGLGGVLGGVDLWIDGQRRLNRLRVTPTLMGASATFTF